MREIWKDIPGYKNIYQASTLGRIRSLKRKLRSKHGYRVTKTIILSEGINKDNRRNIILHKNGNNKTQRIHSVILRTFKGNPPKGYECNHIDGDVSNNNLNNLEWVPRKYNSFHRDYILQKNNFGEKQHQSKLTKKDVIKIKKILLQGKLNQRQIAKKFNVNYTTINGIKTEKSWAHLFNLQSIVARICLMSGKKTYEEIKLVFTILEILIELQASEEYTIRALDNSLTFKTGSPFGLLHDCVYKKVTKRKK